ncbi:MAG: thermonuclease family protein [Pirellulales bacterium]
MALCLLLVARFWWSGPAASSPAQPPAAGLHHVVRVVDGDTIVIAPDGVVRLIGVDTPETVKPDHAIERFGPEATLFTQQFLSGGTARLTFDRERLDRFGRFLAYVWVEKRLLNEELLRAGLGRFEPQFHYSELMKRRFRRAQEEARQARVGIWSEESETRNSRSRRRDVAKSQLDFPLNRLYCLLPRPPAAKSPLP